MASISGSQAISGSKLAFFAPGFTGDKVNVVLSNGITFTGATVAGSFNIEVFTTAASAGLPKGANFDASAYVDGAVKVAGTTNEITAGTLGSAEQLLVGNYLVIDRTGGESIQIVGSSSCWQVVPTKCQQLPP